MPIFVRSCETAHLDPQHDADVFHRDFGQQPLKALAVVGSAPAQAQVFVDDKDSLRGPGQRGHPPFQDCDIVMIATTCFAYIAYDEHTGIANCGNFEIMDGPFRLLWMAPFVCK